MTHDDIHRCFAPSITPQEQAKLYTLLQQVDQALSDREYILCWGGLLGFVRFGKLLPWDDDIDLLVIDPPDDLQDRLPNLKVLAGKYTKICDPKDPPIKGRDYSFPFIELNPAWEEGECVCTKSAFGLPDDRFPAEYIFPIQRAKFGPIEVNLPADPEKLAKYKYGDLCITHARAPYWSHKHERRTDYPQDRVPLSMIQAPLGWQFSGVEFNNDSVV